MHLIFLCSEMHKVCEKKSIQFFNDKNGSENTIQFCNISTYCNIQNVILKQFLFQVNSQDTAEIRFQGIFKFHAYSRWESENCAVIPTVMQLEVFGSKMRPRKYFG